MSLRLLAVFQLLFMQFSYAEIGNINVERFENKLDEKEIFKFYSPEALSKLVGLFEERIIEMSAILDRDKKSNGSELSKKEREDLEELLENYKSSLVILSTDIAAATNNRELSRIYKSGKRMIFALSKDELKPQYFKPGALLGLIFSPRVKLNYVEPSLVGTKVKSFKVAEKEARNLVRVEEGGIRNSMDITGIIGQTIDEISRLEIPRNHTHFYSNTYLKSHSDTWSELEQKVEKAASIFLSSDEGKHKLKESQRYSLDSARKVLFFSKVKDSATGAKINTKDIFGLKWKMKWGSEVQTEPVANRMYMKLGTKFVDLLYVSHFQKSPQYLILDEEDDIDEMKRSDFKKGCRSAASVEGFITCLKKSKYHYDIKPYIKESGIIDYQYFKTKLKPLLPETGISYKKIKEKFLGRPYILLTESLVEFQGDTNFIKRVGPVAFHGLGAEKDRVARGMALFNVFLNNKDAKAQNNKAFLFLSDEMRYYENQHDIGAVFGNLFYEGKINLMQTGKKFAKVIRVPGKNQYGLKNKKVRFAGFYIFKPKAWKAATPADLLWMARKISSISDTEFKEMVSHTLWPDFAQAVYVYKLKARRNRIAKLYGLEKLVKGEINETLSFDPIDLSTDSARAKAAFKYSIPKEKIVELMSDKKLIKSDGSSQYHDPVVTDNKLTSCRKNILTGLIEQYSHPTGVYRRLIRIFDQRGLGKCHL
ncbi:MAG: hypothetical protein HOE90_20665 [Bacteriovoracaceae bacterium]|jgi:hypothetical protein|nr:hypothetical protein [Bacteriovoracaceae bacterium]